jgi:hypothetical protein
VSDLIVFLVIVGLVVAVGIAVGMIVATRLDRIMTPVPKPRDPEPGPPATEETKP